MSDEAKDDVPGVVMLPPYILAIAIAAMVLLEIILPFSFLPPFAPGSLVFWLGGILCLGGVVLAAAGIYAFRQAGTNIPPDKPALKLVTDGPYRFTRNPMYLGMLCLLAGLTLCFSLDWGIFAWPVFLMVLHYGVILREERYMTRKFGTPYKAFLDKTRRYL